MFCTFFDREAKARWVIGVFGLRSAGQHSYGLGKTCRWVNAGLIFPDLLNVWQIKAIAPGDGFDRGEIRG